jgi:hypothetical protein
MPMWHAVESSADVACIVYEKSRRRLQHLVAGGKIRTMCEIDLKVAQPVIVIGVGTQQAAHLRTARTHFGTELHQSCSRSQRIAVCIGGIEAQVPAVSATSIEQTKHDAYPDSEQD